jgi:protease I
MGLPHLDGAKIGVVVENKFIPEEIEAYRNGFGLLGAEVEFLSRIWYGGEKPKKPTTFYSDVDPQDNEAWESPHRLAVQRDVSDCQPADFAAVIMSANYTSVRLRYGGLPQPHDLTDEYIKRFDARTQVKAAPLVKFFATAMANKRVVKGLLCHGLWILTPDPDLLRGRKVICHEVVMADIMNCGAQIVLNRDGVVVDGDLVTGFSKHQVLPFITAVAEQIVALGRC